MDDRFIMKLDANLVEKTTKTGNKYKCVVLNIAPGVESLVFLKSAELKLLELTSGNLNTSYPVDDNFSTME